MPDRRQTARTVGHKYGVPMKTEDFALWLLVSVFVAFLAWVYYDSYCDDQRFYRFATTNEVPFLCR